jgi:N-acetylmuramoyl-L-alanine amidase
MRPQTLPWTAAAIIAASVLVLAAAPSAGAQAKQQATIVIDPGHGGLDVGAKGKFGRLEKDITLAISLKLKALIEQNQAYRVVLTRDKDIDVSLENRAAVANNNGAALFISVHVNGSFRKIARGSETYFLSLNATDDETRKLAYLENSSASLQGRIAGESKDDVTMILWDMAQAAYIKQSGRLAEEIQKELNQALGIENRGIKQADFKVLRGVACPAVLVEAAFISNPEEEEKLVSEEFQSQVAQAVYDGLARFLKSAASK